MYGGKTSKKEAAGPEKMKNGVYISARKEKSSLKRKKRGFGGVRKFSGISLNYPII
jgi:hypothetical protein